MYEKIAGLVETRARFAGRWQGPSSTFNGVVMRAHREGRGESTPGVNQGQARRSVIHLSNYHTQWGEEQSREQAREDHTPTVTRASVHVPSPPLTNSCSLRSPTCWINPHSTVERWSWILRK